METITAYGNINGSHRWWRACNGKDYENNINEDKMKTNFIAATVLAIVLVVLVPVYPLHLDTNGAIAYSLGIVVLMATGFVADRMSGQ